MTNKYSVLIIEDEAAIRDMLKFALEGSEFDLQEAENTRQADNILKKHIPDLILLDWMLPGCSGIQYIQQLKQQTHTQIIPLIMLTARAEEHYKIRGLENGADDYIVKPFSPLELIARMRSVLRRGGKIFKHILITGKLRINMLTHEILNEKNKIKLTALEYKLLLFFAQHPKKNYTREQLLNAVWSHYEDTDSRTIDVHIRRLRNKLKIFNCQHYIITLRGTGYCYNDESNTA